MCVSSRDRESHNVENSRPHPQPIVDLRQSSLHQLQLVERPYLNGVGGDERAPGADEHD